MTSDPGGSTFPSIDEVAAFVGDYYQASGRPPTAGGWPLIGAAAVWLLAYTSRCEHALDARGVARPDQHGARDRLASDGEAMLALSGVDAGT